MAFWWSMTRRAPKSTSQETPTTKNRANESRNNGIYKRLNLVQQAARNTTRTTAESAVLATHSDHYFVRDPSSPRAQSFAITAELKRLNEEIGKLTQRNVALEKLNQDVKAGHQKSIADRDLYKASALELVAKNRTQEQQIKGKEKQIQAFQKQWEMVCNSLLVPFRDERLSGHEQEELRSLDFVLGRIRDDAFEIAPLRERHQRLQQEMLANVERTSSMSDEQFEKQYRQLASAIKGVTRSVSSQSFDATAGSYRDFRLLQDVPEKYWDTRSRKKSRLEAVVWSVLVDNVFLNPFLTFGTQIPVLRGLALVWTDTFGSSHHYDWPVPSPCSEMWRHITIEHLLHSTTRAVFTGDEPFEVEHGNDFQRSVHGAKCTVFEQIYRIFEDLEPGYDGKWLEAIVHKAFTLAIDMFSQRCRFQIMWPEVGETYLFGETTGLTSIPESEEVLSGRVAFTVNPGLTKWGDAYGKCLDQRLDIVPALVFIEEEVHETPGPEQHEMQGDRPRNIESLQNGLDGDRLGELMVGGVLVAGGKPLGKEQLNVLETSTQAQSETIVTSEQEGTNPAL
jgi:hypothetical protein